MQFFTTLATMVAAASAIMINSPAQNAVWTSGQSQTVSWSSVNTDASAMSIYLVNFSRYPTSSVLIQANVPSSAGSITVPGANITSTGQGYQVNFLAVDNPSQILAQSNQFSIVAGAAASSASTTAAAAAAAATTSAAAVVATSSTAAAAAASSSAAAVLPASNSTLPTTTKTSGASVNAISSVGLALVGSVLYFF